MINSILPNKNQVAILLVLLCLFNPALADDKPTVIPEVTLSPQANKNLQKKTSAQKTEINRKKIAASPETTVSGILQRQSVVRLTNNSGDNNQTAISLRGFGDNAVANSLILVDGFPLINPTLLAPSINSILLSDIEKIKIFQGSQGSLYGDQAVGGVLNIITRHPEKKFCDFDLSYGSYNGKFLSGIFGDKLSNGFFFKGMGFSNHNDNFRDHNQQDNAGLALQEGLDYSSGTVYLNQKIYDDSINFPGALTKAQYDADPSQATDFVNNSHNITQIYQLFNKQAINNNWLLETWVAHNDVRGHGFIFWPFNSDQWLNSINPQLVGDINNNKIIVGYSGQDTFYQDVSTVVQSRARSEQNNVYAQTILPILQKWDLTLGARSAWQDNAPEIVIGQPIHYVDRAFVTEEGLAFHPNNAWSFFLRRDGNFRFPKANEEVWVPVNVTTLKAQTGVSYESGVEWDTLKHKTQLSVYELDLRNEIAFDPTQTPLQPFGAVTNFPATKRQGVTLTESYQCTKNLAFDSQVNYVDARFSAGPYSGNYIPGVPAWNGNLDVDYKFLTHWKASYTALYTGSAYASDDVANIAGRIPSYWLHKIALQYFFKKVVLSFEVNNLFNQRYALFTDYNPFFQSLSYYPGAGRNYLLTAKVNLD